MASKISVTTNAVSSSSSYTNGTNNNNNKRSSSVNRVNGQHNTTTSSSSANLPPPPSSSLPMPQSNSDEALLVLASSPRHERYRAAHGSPSNPNLEQMVAAKQTSEGCASHTYTTTYHPMFVSPTPNVVVFFVASHRLEDISFSLPPPPPPPPLTNPINISPNTPYHLSLQTYRVY